MVFLRLLRDLNPNLRAGQVERFAPLIAEKLLKDGYAEYVGQHSTVDGPPVDKQVRSSTRKK